ncbi:uncharacterized protein LOC113296300 [Papaver somniferum]|uniref:uncharacterized protein LOC113296300 n=1 Tax=Papaver somniferum TaxID=3469 RepID=UPI000E702EEE|nr:uncharacterized protein LOC113296300 [Papaver somniferum]
MKFIQRIQQIHEKVHENLEKTQAQYKQRHDKHRTEHTFEIGDLVWLAIGKNRLQGPQKKLKPIRYGPFRILEQYGTNDFKLDLPSYMQIYSTENVENLKLFEPLLLDERNESPLLPVVQDLIPSEVATEDMVLSKKTRMSRVREQELFQVCLKGKIFKHAKWYSREQLQAKYPHLLVQCF